MLLLSQPRGVHLSIPQPCCSGSCRKPGICGRSRTDGRGTSSRSDAQLRRAPVRHPAVPRRLWRTASTSPTRTRIIIIRADRYGWRSSTSWRGRVGRLDLASLRVHAGPPPQDLAHAGRAASGSPLLRSSVTSAAASGERCSTLGSHLKVERRDRKPLPRSLNSLIAASRLRATGDSESCGGISRYA